MKKNIAYIILIAASWFVGCPAEAGSLDSLQLKARAGYSIGGTTPIPLPETIRSIDSYSLTPSFMVGLDAMLPLTQQWGIMTGLRLENKGMKATWLRETRRCRVFSRAALSRRSSSGC